MDDIVSYKALKEDFVSNLTGGTITEINYVTAVAPAALIVWSVLQSRLLFFTRYGPLPFAVDFLLNIGCILLAITLYSSMPMSLLILLLAPAIFSYFLPLDPLRKTQAKRPKPRGEKMDDLPLKPFLTIYRGNMMVITCLAILAVDFRTFPRRFAKAENWGTSLMDLGVGSFVFSAGIVAAKPVLKEESSGHQARLGSRLYTSMRHSLPLIVLGLVRLYSVKGLDYAEHVTEYGVHWNFFFTIALLPPFVAIFQSAFQIVPSHAALALLLGSCYQIALDCTSLKAFILTAPRTDLFSKNREGIFSFFGYLAIFLAGQGSGMHVIPRRVTTKVSPDGHTQRMRLLVTMALWSGGWVVLYSLSTSYHFGLALTVSRRLANLPYFLWVAAFNCVQLSVFCGIETWFFPGFHLATDRAEEKHVYDLATSRILTAFNRNGLAIFLLANVLTGLINLTIPTLHVGDIPAMGVLLGYAATITAAAILLDMYDISIKM
ncbi:MAG: Glucosaminyl phosphatidylinositol (GlcN-PI) nositol acylation protein [Claussenomyces sp. TS43310]|nr:MAG: Glucosaminyl phosphatidylinositol (GlcN-PI) nositol acylation protein [Claussenomyces sp. TS43310]